MFQFLFKSCIIKLSNLIEVKFLSSFIYKNANNFKVRDYTVRSAIVLYFQMFLVYYSVSC